MQVKLSPNGPVSMPLPVLRLKPLPRLGEVPIFVALRRQLVRKAAMGGTRMKEGGAYGTVMVKAALWASSRLASCVNS